MKAKTIYLRPAAVVLLALVERTVARAVLCAISAYRFVLSPMFVVLFGRACRFTPSCSEYAHQAIVNHGLWRGAGLAVRRLLRCRPGGGWGYDPVSCAAASSRQPEGKLLG